MLPIRLKVQVGDNKSNENTYRKRTLLPIKFVYCLQSPSCTSINELIHLLQSYILTRYSIKNLRLIQLMTDDGYFLSNNENCNMLLKDNDRIICIDMDKFIEQNYSTLDLENLWCEIRQHDVSDNSEKYIQIGLNDIGKLFLRIYGTSKHYGLYMFNLFDLNEIRENKSKDNIIIRMNDENWFIEAKWEYESNLENVIYLVCSLKVNSNEQIWSKKICILLNHSDLSIEKGEIISLSCNINDDDNLNDQQRQHLMEVISKIPSVKRIGPQLLNEKDKNRKLTKYECEGESLIQMIYGNTNTVTAYQDPYLSDDGTFYQYFVITHITFLIKSNDTSKELHNKHSLVNLTVLYEANDKSWHECEDIAIASITLRDEEPRWLADSVINIESDKLISLAIRGKIKIHGQPGNDNITRRRIHSSLPQPFKLKIVLTDNVNKQCSLIVEQLNKPIEYETFDSFFKSNQSSINNLLGFVYADDCNSNKRVFMAIYFNKDDEIVIQADHTSSITLDRRYLRTMEYNAKQNNTNEIVLDSISYRYDDQEGKAIALFDSYCSLIYAIRFEVCSRTSQTEETIVLPLEKMK